MVLTESCKYHATHIGAIRTFKEDLKETYNVKIHITNKLIGSPSGTLQEVTITGSLINITKVKNKLTNIVSQAEYDYQEYRKRKNSRIQSSKKNINLSDLNISKVSVIKKKSTNPFYILEGLDEDDNDSSSDESIELINVDNGDNGDTCIDVLKESCKDLELSDGYDPSLSWGDQLD